MTDSEFQTLADTTLAAIERAIDELDADIEASRAGNVLTLEVADGSRIIVNSQGPMQQMWVAARSGAHHFAWNASEWRDTRDGSEMFDLLSRLLSTQGDRAVILRRFRP